MKDNININIPTLLKQIKTANKGAFSDAWEKSPDFILYAFMQVVALEETLQNC